jgi:hypothetical protein
MLSDKQEAGMPRRDKKRLAEIQAMLNERLSPEEEIEVARFRLSGAREMLINLESGDLAFANRAELTEFTRKEIARLEAIVAIHEAK